VQQSLLPLLSPTATDATSAAACLAGTLSMAPWDERVATWHCVTQLAALPGIASRRAASADAPAAAAATTAAALPPPPPLCLAPAGPVQELRFDGSPAWAALVPSAAAALAASVPSASAAAAAASTVLPLPLQRVPALYRGPRQLSCTYAFEWRCAGGTYRVCTHRTPIAPIRMHLTP
jgi:hypothetical protein